MGADAKDTVLSIGQQIKDVLAESNDAKFFVLKMDKDQKLILDLSGPLETDFNLYVKFGSRPTASKNDYRSTGGSSRESVTIDKTRKGKYYAMVHSNSGKGKFLLAASAGESARILIITSRKNLAGKFGEGNFQRIENGIDSYVKALQGSGMPADRIYVDDTASLSPYGLDPVDPSDASQVKGLIDALDEKISPAYFLILGGHEIIPFHRLSNPAGDDGDTVVDSDNPYASTDADFLIPERALGRLPDDSSRDPGFFLSVLETAANRAREAGDSAFGLSANVWVKASQKVYDSVKSNQDVTVSPPEKESTFLTGWIDKKTYHYFNLHGGEDTSDWYGQQGENQPVIPAYKPGNLTGADVENVIICSEACYGANIIGKGVEDAISLTYLQKKAACFVGSTKIAYGPAVPPSMEADLLVSKFFDRIKEGLTFGDAFMKAKQDFARETIAASKGLDGTDKKTLIEFVLYADPSSKVVIT